MTADERLADARDFVKEEMAREIERLREDARFGWANAREIDKTVAARDAEIVALHEQVAALESREVCAVAHENVEACGYCQRDRLRSQLELITAMGGMTLLGGGDLDSERAHELGAAKAFEQAADIARSALAHESP